MSWIEMEGFSYTYPGETTPVLKEVNFSLERGAFVVLTGKSGSGKSTLGKALAGFLFNDEDPRFSGEIIVNGSDMTRIPLYQASERVGYVQQNSEDQFCTLTVQDEIAFGLENACVDPSQIEEKVDQALSVVTGLHLKNRDLHSLSGGEQQKIAIASMLALSPDVLILDEPTSNLDPIATGSIFETLHAIRQIQNMTVIIIEHKLSQLIKFNPQIITIDGGRIKPGWYPYSQENQSGINSLEFPTTPSTTTSPNPIIDIANLTVVRNKQEILKDLNLSLSSGQFVALMGPNGSGKSTLLQTLMGFHKITSGEAKVFNRDINDVKVSDFVKEIGFIFQNPDHQLFEQSVLAETTLTTRNMNQFDQETEQRAREWLTQIGLQDRLEDHPQKLSYGEKRRLNLVAVLLHEPKLLLVDEFLIGQDMINANRWMDFFKRYTRLGHTVLLVIHHAGLTLNYCDRLIFLEDGKVLIDDEAKTAFENLHTLNYEAFLPDENWGSGNA